MLSYILCLIFLSEPVDVSENDKNDEDASIQTEPLPEPEPTNVLPEKIDFQPLVDRWVSSVGGNRSVLVYDLDREELVGSYNPDESYNTASLYKLFVVYEGYRKLQSGEWSESGTVSGTQKTILQCLDLAIRESNSACAESLWAMIGRDALNDVIINDYGIVNSNISSLISNPSDILKMMQIYYKHEDITDTSLVSLMKDSFLHQPVTTYNWRQGLPSGFTRADVYNKVGWDYNPDGKYWNIYHDTAIVVFPEEERHFIITIMTNKVPFQKITEFGREFENTYYQYVLKN
ncbi:serine hydrolase [Candidatus Saccharibacteria bacterium]|nr:serine hydrolase [Candidatus Saccharibacteria bacterium]